MDTHLRGAGKMTAWNRGKIYTPPNIKHLPNVMFTPVSTYFHTFDPQNPCYTVQHSWTFHTIDLWPEVWRAEQFLRQFSGRGLPLCCWSWPQLFATTQSLCASSSEHLCRIGSSQSYVFSGGREGGNIISGLHCITAPCVRTYVDLMIFYFKNYYLKILCCKFCFISVQFSARFVSTECFTPCTCTSMQL